MGITLDELVFDPANPDDGANVGATLRGADGTVIGNTGDALKVTGSFNVDGSEVALDSATLAALENITVSATDLDVRDLTFATDKVDVTGSEVSLDAASLAALENITVTVDNSEIEITNDAGNPIPVSATDLDIRNLVFADDKVDVTGSEVSLDAATLAALETVNVTDGGGSLTVDAIDLDIRDLTFATDKVDASGSEVKQDSFDSIKNSAQSVTTTASALAGTPLANRVKMLIQNLGTKDIFIGSDNTVTDSNGVKIPRGASAEFMFSAASTPHAITDSGTADVRILEMAY
jgi:hypothetical protein